LVVHRLQPRWSGRIPEIHLKQVSRHIHCTWMGASSGKRFSSTRGSFPKSLAALPALQDPDVVLKHANPFPPSAFIWRLAEVRFVGIGCGDTKAMPSPHKIYAERTRQRTQDKFATFSALMLQGSFFLRRGWLSESSDAVISKISCDSGGNVVGGGHGTASVDDGCGAAKS
jgi:hypothetical protein